MDDKDNPLYSPITIPYPWTTNYDGTRLTLKNPMEHMMEIEHHFNMLSFDWKTYNFKKHLDQFTELYYIKSKAT